EERPRVAAPAFAFRVRLGGRAAHGDLRRSTPAADVSRPLARLPPASRGGGFALARAQSRPRQRPGGLPPAPGRLLSRPFPPLRTRASIAPNPVRGALPHLPAGARRRRVHVPDAAPVGAARRSPCGRASRLALAGGGQPRAARILCLRRVA